VASIFKCSGNSYANNFSVTDKTTFRTVTRVSERQSLALFHSEEPHGLHYNEKVQVTFDSRVDQSTGTFSSGGYYAIPFDTFSFFLSKGTQGGELSEPYVSFNSLPSLPDNHSVIFRVTNTLHSSHRLRVFEVASLSEIDEYFTKVQKAFSSFFGGRVTDGHELVNTADHVIVSDTGQYPLNLSSNSTRNSSFYANQVNLRSNYGLCWGDFDGSLVSGFKSIIANACTAVSLQNDPEVYEIYTTLQNPETGLPEEKWWNLPLAAFLSLPESEKPSSPAEVSWDRPLLL
jgi:hypothetical protein